MADGCTTVILVGVVTFFLYYLLSCITKGNSKVIKKTRGKPNEPIKCEITELVSLVIVVV